MTPHEAWATISGCFGAAVLILCLLADAARGLCRAARRAPQALHALAEGYTRARESAAMWLALRPIRRLKCQYFRSDLQSELRLPTSVAKDMQAE